MTEDELVGWHHQLNGHEFKQAPGVVYGVEDWYAAVHSVSKRWTWLSNWTEQKVKIDISWNLGWMYICKNKDFLNIVRKVYVMYI